MALACPNAANTQDGVRLGAAYTTDLLTVVDGGVQRGGAWLGRADATLEVDGGLLSLDGAAFFFDVIYTHGPDFSGTRVGDTQVVSNVQGDAILRPYEAWVSVPLGEAGLSAKVGLVDLNTEFDIQSVGAFFLNSSHGIGPDLSQTGISGSSIFPVTSPAILPKWEGKDWSARAGLFNGVTGDPDRPDRLRLPYPGQDSALIIAEADVALGPFEAQLGVWADTSCSETIEAAAGVPGPGRAKGGRAAPMSNWKAGSQAMRRACGSRAGSGSVRPAGEPTASRATPAAASPPPATATATARSGWRSRMRSRAIADIVRLRSKARRSTRRPPSSSVTRSS